MLPIGLAFIRYDKRELDACRVTRSLYGRYIAMGDYQGGGQGTTTSINFAPFPSTLVNGLPTAQLQATDNGAFAATVQLNTLGNNSGNPTPSLLQPRQTWNTDGTIAFPTMPNVPTAGSVDLTIDASGNVAPQTSSARFKADIEPLCDDFQRILGLQPKQFRSVSTGDRSIGYIAEDVAALSLR